MRGDDDDKDWDAVVLNHVLVHVLDKDQVEASAADDFNAFVITNGIDDVRLLMTVSADDFKSMECDINFKTFCAFQTLNKMYNVQGQQEYVVSQFGKTCGDVLHDVQCESDYNTFFCGYYHT